MHANTINSLILLTIILALIGLYCSVYSRGVAVGTDAGYKGGRSAGKSTAAAEFSSLIRTTRADAEQLRHLREIERREYRTALEAIMLDCDQRICIFARRANPFTENDQVVLSAIANKLKLAAGTFDGLNSPDRARLARSLQTHALNMAERLRTALEHSAATPASFEHPDATLIEWLNKEAIYSGDEEHGELRFPVTSPHTGFEHVRDVLRLAVRQQQALEAGQEVMA
jgi:hypothetical protein